MIHATRLGAAVLLLVGVSAVRSQTRDERPFTDAEFVKMAASSGMAEVELGKLAQTKARNEGVKKLAEMLVNDHTKANEELKKVAKEAGLEVPEKLLDKHQQAVTMFKEYKGTNFDADFVKQQIKSHEEGVALFTRASKEAKNEKIKAFATKTLPTLQQHLEHAKKLSVRE
jgi:putative membrane protein